MAFTTLEERFNQVSKQIYGRFSPSKDQLVSVKPETSGPLGSKSRIKSDTRLLPLVSTIRDVKRVSKFLTSTEGVLFLGKQLLLQTGNTFAETRIYNPVEILLNADPFLGRGSIRHIDTNNKFNFKTNTRINRGALQTETVAKFGSPTTNNSLLGRIGSQIGGVTSAYLNGGNSAPQPTKYFDGRDEFYTRPEDTVFKLPLSQLTFINPYLPNVQILKERGTKKPTPKLPTNEASLVNTNRSFKEQFTNWSGGRLNFLDLEKRLDGNGYFYGNEIDLNGPTVTLPNESDSSDVSDPLNTLTPKIHGTTLYRNIFGNPKKNFGIYSPPEVKPDIIKFIFQTVGKDPIHFRAFISTFKQTVKPEFSEQRYIGRTERFVTYAGAKRTATLEFDIAAFSQREIDQAWARINYLTGLAFPIDSSESGFMVPPMFRLTVGGIYDNQPCYLDSLDFDFIGDNTTFDIDSEVTQVIHVNMSVVLLEKSSKFYDSPFYEITQQLRNLQLEEDAAREATRNRRPVKVAPDPSLITSTLPPIGTPNVRPGGDIPESSRATIRAGLQANEQFRAALPNTTDSPEALGQRFRDEMSRYRESMVDVPQTSANSLLENLRDEMQMEENRPITRALMPGDSYYTYRRPYAQPFGTGNAAITPVGPPIP